MGSRQRDGGGRITPDDAEAVFIFRRIGLDRKAVATLPIWEFDLLLAAARNYFPEFSREPVSELDVLTTPSFDPSSWED